MNSVGPECMELKKQYDECFNVWFAEQFLKGKTKDVCGSIFKVYQECVKNAIKRQNIDVTEIDKGILDTNGEQKSHS